MSNFLFLKDNDLVQYITQYAMLLVAVVCFAIGSFIDTKNLKILTVVLITIIIFRKILSFDYFGLGEDVVNRISVTNMASRLALYFIF